MFENLFSSIGNGIENVSGAWSQYYMASTMQDVLPPFEQQEQTPLPRDGYTATDTSAALMSYLESNKETYIVVGIAAAVVLVAVLLPKGK